MIFKIILVSVYLIIGLFLFIRAIQLLGGMKAAGYSNVFVYILGLITVTITWPIFIIYGLLKGND